MVIDDNENTLTHPQEDVHRFLEIEIHYLILNVDYLETESKRK